MSELPITAERAQIAVQRLVNSLFNTKNQARCSIPARADDDDLVAAAYIEQSAERIAKLEAENAEQQSQLKSAGEVLGKVCVLGTLIPGEKAIDLPEHGAIYAILDVISQRNQLAIELAALREQGRAL